MPRLYLLQPHRYGLAKWLHRSLEGFRIDKDLVGRETATGTIPKSLRPIFRDRDDFTAGEMRMSVYWGEADIAAAQTQVF